MNIGNTGDQDRIKELLKQAVPPIEDADQVPRRDLWPAMLRRMDEPAVSHWPKFRLLDLAMLAGLAAMVLFAPVSIPLLLYYL